MLIDPQCGLNCVVNKRWSTGRDRLFVVLLRVVVEGGRAEQLVSRLVS